MRKRKMDSRFHATVMRRPEDDEEEAVIRRNGIMNGPSTINTSTTNGSNISYDIASPRQQSQTEIRSILNPSSTNSTGAHLHFNPYHSSTAAPPQLIPPHIPLPPTSAGLTLGPPSYQIERDPNYSRDQKPISNYYDPTSDSSERRTTEQSWSDRKANNTSQVRYFPVNPARRIFSNLKPYKQTREPYPYQQNHPPPPQSSTDAQLNHYNSIYKSPVNTHFPPGSPISHAHPRGRVPSITRSPRMTTMESPVSRHNGLGGGSVKQDRPPAQEEPIQASVSRNYLCSIFHL